MPTIKEVAEKAGLSVSCVSKYLNHPEHVLPETKEKIEEAMAHLNYTPSVIARSLRTKRTNIIVVVMESVRNPFFAEVFDHLRRQLEKFGYKAMLHTISQQGCKPTDFSFADGVIICFPDHEAVITEVNQASGNIPKIILHSHPLKPQETGVVCNVGIGSRLAAEHLFRKGCRSFLLVCGPKDSSASPEKTRAILEYLEQAEEAVNCIRVHCRNDCDGGMEGIGQVRQSLEHIDGILCESDVLTMGVITKLTQIGYRIPRDMQVVGYDNISLSRTYSPGITTVAIPIPEMCEDAAGMMVQRIEGNAVENGYYSPQLIIRETTR